MDDPHALPTQSSQVRVRLKHKEWEVEITCAEDKVKEVVQNVLRSIDQSVHLDVQDSVSIADMQNQIENLKALIGSNAIGPASGRIRGERNLPHKAGMTCRLLLEKLWEEGYFISKRPLAEIHEELLRRGYKYDRTAVSHSLTDMVRESILVREGTARNYHYLQKTENRPENRSLS